MIDPDIRDDDPIDADDRTVRQFAALCGLLLAAVAARAFLRGHPAGAAAAVTLALAVAVLGLVRPKAVRPLFVAAMAVAAPIRRIVSGVLLGLVYYALFTPIAVAFRLVGRDALSRRRSRQASTYWTRKPKPVDPSSYFRQS